MHNATDLRTLDGPLAWLKELFRRFQADQCPAWAAALSFFALLSIPSVLLCGLAVLGFLIRTPGEATRQVEQYIERVVPGKNARASARELIKQLNVEKTAEEIRKRRGVTAVVGAGLLIWAAIQIFVNACVPLNAAFNVRETRSWWRKYLAALGMLLGVGTLFLLSLAPSVVVRILSAWNSPFDLTFFNAVGLYLTGILINAVLFALIYRFLPSPEAKIDWREAMLGGGIVAVLWEIAKQAFAVYLTQFGGGAGYERLYGSLGGLFLLIAWINLSSLLLLLGAEIAKLYSDWRDMVDKTEQEALAEAAKMNANLPVKPGQAVVSRPVWIVGTVITLGVFIGEWLSQKRRTK